MEVSGQLHAPPALPTNKYIPVPTGYESEWASKLFWRHCRIENLLLLLGIEPQFLCHAAHSLVPISIELSPFLCA
jgi:hypothetical protein